jgi:glycosyltransferase involved in cell wall biosynthesis
MRVTLVSTNDRMGGAARCSIRIWDALSRAETDAVLLCLRRSLDVPGIECAADQLGRDTSLALEESWELLRGQWRGLTTDRCVSMVTPSGPGVDISGLEAIRRADVINLHWTTWFLSPRDIAALAGLGKPLVWTLHDESAFTGGCHYAAECDGFTRDCTDCPQVVPEARALVARAFQKKRTALAGLPLTVVTTSRWLAGRARASSLLGDRRIEVLPSGLDTDVFAPGPSRLAAKRSLGLSPHERIVLMPASTLSDVRKGAAIVDDYLSRLARCAADAAGTWGGRYRVIFFGNTDRDLSQLPVPAACLGEMHEEAALARAYAGADCVVTLSGHDNLPNTVHEAMSCGTPVAAFDVGGVGDMIEHGRQGLLAAPGDVAALAALTARMLADPADTARMGDTARATAVERYALPVAAGRYLDLFNDLPANAGTARDTHLTTQNAPRTPEDSAPWPADGSRLRAEAERIRQVNDTIRRAFALRDEGRHSEGLALVDSLLRTLPGNVELSLVRGGLLVASGAPRQAARWLADLYAKHPVNRIGLSLSDALRLAGDPGKALDVVEAMARPNPLAPGLHKKRGQALHALGEPRQALRLYFREYRLHRDGHALALARAILADGIPLPAPLSQETRMHFCLDCNDTEKEITRASSPYTMTSGERLLGLIRAVEYIAKHYIPGSIVECGVWKGGSSMAAALALQAFEGAGRHLYLFDTFTGMTAPTAEDVAFDGSHAEPVYMENRTPTGECSWCQAGLDEVKENMHSTGYPEDHIHLIPGPVETTLPGHAPETIALLRLDTDWYESTRHELEHLYPRLSPGGVLIIDDYGHWEGARKAVDEYIAAHGLQLLLTRMDYTGRLAVKPWQDGKR